MPACLSRRASSSTLGLSTLLWERKTSYWLLDGAAMRDTYPGTIGLVIHHFGPRFPAQEESAGLLLYLFDKKALLMRHVARQGDHGRGSRYPSRATLS